MTTCGEAGHDYTDHLVEIESTAHYSTDARTRSWDLPDGRTLVASLTDEGVIIDAYHGDEHVGTHAMTADEWYDDLVADDLGVRP